MQAQGDTSRPHGSADGLASANASVDGMPFVVEFRKYPFPPPRTPLAVPVRAKQPPRKAILKRWRSAKHCASVAATVTAATAVPAATACARDCSTPSSLPFTSLEHIDDNRMDAAEGIHADAATVIEPVVSPARIRDWAPDMEISGQSSSAHARRAGSGGSACGETAGLELPLPERRLTTSGSENESSAASTPRLRALSSPLTRRRERSRNATSLLDDLRREERNLERSEVEEIARIAAERCTRVGYSRPEDISVVRSGLRKLRKRAADDVVRVSTRYAGMNVPTGPHVAVKLVLNEMPRQALAEIKVILERERGQTRILASERLNEIRRRIREAQDLAREENESSE